MKLKQKNGKVTFLMRAGSEFVRDTMSVEDAERIISEGKTERISNADGFNISVNNKYMFITEDEKPKKVKRTTESE